MNDKLVEVVQLQRAEQQMASSRIRLEIRMRVGRKISRPRIKVTKSLWLCLGCGEVKALKRRTYCDKCRRRLDDGWQNLDVDDLPTHRECLRVKAVAFRLFGAK